MRYRTPYGTALDWDDHPLIRTAEGGLVVVDPEVQHLWTLARDATLDEIRERASRFEWLGGAVPEAVACLAEARLIERAGFEAPAHRAPAVRGPAVSAVIVVSSPLEREWLDALVRSILSQAYAPLEIVLVDNPHPDDVERVARVDDPRVRIVTMPSRGTFARTLNAGIAAARGEHFLLINADTIARPGAIAALVARVQQADDVAAVAPKLLFARAPGFLNGIGNRVRSFGWATDNGIGQVDLGQFDDLDELPSACFSAALVSRRAVDAVGGLDERFTAYYEDVEWCYRARLAGWRIRAAPSAEVLHYFGGYWQGRAAASDMSLGKRERAMAGRLRFAALVASAGTCARFLANYAREDGINAVHALREGKREVAATLAHGWLRFAAGLPEVVRRRREVQRLRAVPDPRLWSDEASMPFSFTWRSAPVLTAEIIVKHYVPFIRAGKTRPLPECAAPATCTTKPSLGR